MVDAAQQCASEEPRGLGQPPDHASTYSMLAAAEAQKCNAQGQGACGLPVPGNVQPRHRPNLSGT